MMAAVDFSKSHNETNGTAPPDPWSPLLSAATEEWFTKPPAAREWLLRDARHKGEGVLPLGKVGHLVAEGGAGKTMLLVQLAVAVATGTQWLDVLDVAKPGKVLLALGEEDLEEVRRRLYRARKSASTPIPTEDSIVTLPLAGCVCPLVESDENGNPRDTAFCHWLRGVVERDSWSLVVIDPLSRFAGLDAETDNAAGTRYIQALESFAAFGPTVLDAHHTNKLARGKGGRVEAHSARGSSSIVDGSRWTAVLAREELEHDDADVAERLGQVVTLAFVKSNYSRKAAPIELRYDQDNGGALVPLDDADREMVRTARSGATQAAQREASNSDARRRQAEEDDEAARGARAAHPDAKVGDLCALVRKARGCGQARAHAAVSRVRRSA